MLGTHPQYHQHAGDQSAPTPTPDFGPLSVSNLKTKKSSVAFDILPTTTTSPAGGPPSPTAAAAGSSAKLASLLSRRFTEPNLHALLHGSTLSHDDHEAAMTRLAALQDHMHDHLHQHNDAHVRAVVDKRHARVTELAAKLDAEHKAAQERAAKKRQEKVEKLHRHNEEVARHKRIHDCGECLRRQASIQYSSFVRHMSDDVAAHDRHMAAGPGPGPGAASHLHRHATHSGSVPHRPTAVDTSAAAVALEHHLMYASSASASYAQLRRSYSYAPGMSMAPPLAPLATTPSATAAHGAPAGPSSTSSSEAGSPIEVMHPPMYEVRRSAMMAMATTRPSGSMSPVSAIVEGLMVPPEYCRRSSSAASIPGCAPLEMGGEE